jgi:hypothetical protein
LFLSVIILNIYEGLRGKVFFWWSRCHLSVHRLKQTGTSVVVLEAPVVLLVMLLVVGIGGCCCKVRWAAVALIVVMKCCWGE